MFGIVKALLGAIGRTGASAAKKPGLVAKVWKAAGLIWRAVSTGADLYVIYDIVREVFGEEVASQMSEADVQEVDRIARTHDVADRPVVVDLTNR